MTRDDQSDDQNCDHILLERFLNHQATDSHLFGGYFSEDERLAEMYQRLVPPVPFPTQAIMPGFGQQQQQGMNEGASGMTTVSPNDVMNRRRQLSALTAFFGKPSVENTFHPQQQQLVQTQQPLQESKITELADASQNSYSSDTSENKKRNPLKKLDRRRERNRLAARRSRQKRASHISQLEQQIQHLQVENMDLRSKLNRILEIRQKKRVL